MLGLFVNWDFGKHICHRGTQTPQCKRSCSGGEGPAPHRAATSVARWHPNRSGCTRGREAHVTSCPGPTPGPASVVTAFLALSPTPLVFSLFPRDGPIRSPPLAWSQLPLALLSGDFHAEPGPLAKRTSRPCASGGFCLPLFFRASPTAADSPFEVLSGRR